MLKIIKYSIILIILSIISSLFILYFYLLKGFSLKDIHYKNLNIGELYIKIEKKLIFKANNIYFISKSTNKKENEKINFKENSKILKNVLQYLSFFQEIKIQNLNINKNKITLISLYKDKFIFDNKDIYLKLSLTPKRDKFIFHFDKLNIKQFNVKLKNIHGNFYSDLLNLYVNIDMIYKEAEIKTHLKISNKHLKYKVSIYNISKKTLSKFKEKLSPIQKLSIYEININGDEKQLSGNIYNSKINIKNLNIDIPKTKIDFNIIKKTALINIPKNNIDLNNTHIEITNTNINYHNIIDADIDNIFIKHNFASVKITNIKANYYKNIVDIFTPTIILYNKNLNLKLLQNKINFNINKNISQIQNNSLKLNYQNQYFIDINNLLTNINLNNNKIQTNFPTLNISNKDIKAKISDNKISYDLNSSNLISYNKKASIDYKTIKSLNLEKISTSFNVNKTYLDTQIPIIKIGNIEIDNLNINLKNNIVDILFHTNTLLSKELNKVLSVFGVNISIYQKTGKNNINGKIKYNLNSNKLNTHLKIDVNNSKLMLTDSTSLDIHYSNLELKDNNISLKNTSLDYNQSIVNLTYNIDKGLINLDKSYIKTYGKFIDLNITDIVEIKNYPENLFIDLKGIDIFLENLKTSILIHKSIIVNIDKLSKFYNYIPYLSEYGLNEGKIKINIDNEIKIISNITDTNQTILEQNLTPLKQIDINTTIKDNNITIYHPKLRINILQDTNLTTIKGGFKDIDLNITKFIDQNKSEDNSSPNIQANIFAKNTYIYYNDVKLYSEKLHIDYNSTNIKVSSIYKDRNISIFSDDGNIKIYGLKIKSKTFQELTNSNILNDPFITFFAIQNKNSEILQGFIEIKSGYIKELKAFTNILAFINLVPSLVTFQALGFTSKGYKIKHGYIEYIFYNKILYFKKITIKGENLTIDGQGYIDLNKKTIKLNVNVNLLIKLVKDIPIVNYILLGKDGGITLKLTIEGDLKDPKVDTNTASNIIEAPLGIIKRTLLTPFRPFIKDDK